MCDTAVRVHAGRVLFAKNSDRDPNEAQLLDWRPRATHAPGATLRCTWVEIPQVRDTHAVLLSRPYWMWGAEMGANEHGLVIGNEAVFTDQPLADLGLTGMDLLRLALERAADATSAVEIITGLIERFGQGGGCGHEDRSFRYSSSFLLADPGGAWLLETAGRKWAAERVRGARSISNGLTLEPFASRHGDGLRTRVADAMRRRSRSEACARRAEGPADMMALLRDHGDEAGAAPRYRIHNGAMAAACVHAGGLLAVSQTTSSWVSELSRLGVRHWATATAAPCTGLFKPVAVAAPLTLLPQPTDRADELSLWWRHERLHRRVMQAPERLLGLYAEERDSWERRWIEEATEPAKAFAEADALLGRWEQRVATTAAPPGHETRERDERPLWVRRIWSRRNRRAGLRIGSPTA